jgi:hypothetical protein
VTSTFAEFVLESLPTKARFQELKNRLGKSGLTEEADTALDKIKINE